MERYPCMDDRMMRGHWTTILQFYHDLFVVVPGVRTDFSFYWGEDDSCLSLGFRFMRDMSKAAAAETSPPRGWRYFSLAIMIDLVAEHRGYYTGGALDELRMRSHFHCIVASEQRVIIRVPQRRVKGLIRRLPICMAGIEVPSGMSMRMPPLATLRVRFLQAESPGGPHDTAHALGG